MSSNLNEIFRQNDETRLRLAVETNSSRVSAHKRQDILKSGGGGTRYWTNWGYVYRILRANFDGYASKACPDPPDCKTGDGQARYLTGKRVTGMHYEGGIVTLAFVDENDKEESIDAEVVVGADGFYSTIGRLVQAPQALSATYAGYFAWRGTVPRRLVSKETADYFHGNASFDFMGNKTYILWCVLFSPPPKP